jgi:hypothetical protein
MTKTTKRKAAQIQATQDEACRQRVYAAAAKYEQSPRTQADWLRFMSVVCNKA